MEILAHFLILLEYKRQPEKDTAAYKSEKVVLYGLYLDKIQKQNSVFQTIGGYDCDGDGDLSQVALLNHSTLKHSFL